MPNSRHLRTLVVPSLESESTSNTFKMLRGERFQIDLDDDVAPDEMPKQNTDQLLGSVVERPSPSVALPPAFKSDTPTGWPTFKKRYQRKSIAGVAAGSSDIPIMSQRNKSLSIENNSSGDALARQEIDAENRRRIAEMSPDEIEQERKELFENLDPALIARLLARSTIDDTSADTTGGSELGSNPRPRSSSSGSGKKVSFALPEQSEGEELVRKQSAGSHSVPLPEPFEAAVPSRTTSVSEASEPTSRRLSNSGRKVSFATPDYAPDNTKPTASHHSLPPTPPAVDGSYEIPPLEHKKSTSERRVSFAVPDEDGGDRSTAHSHSVPITPPIDPLPMGDDIEPENVHFPKPPAVPELDPNSETFLDDLHSKFFPNLVHDPSKLDWMKPSSKEDNISYDPTSAYVIPEAIRFSFKGKIIPPSLSMSLPTNVGLHHHGNTPDAAGYTIAELGILSRSAFPAQRCMAMQTVGRVLYRLGKCEFGDEANLDQPGAPGEGALLTQGLWEEVEKTRVIDTLTEWAKKDSGHRTSIAVATEAVWNWNQGGGRKKNSTYDT
jgi:hypothetical protein